MVPVNLIAANLRASSSIDFPFERFVVEDWPTPLAKAKEDPQRSSRVKFIIFFYRSKVGFHQNGRFLYDIRIYEK